MQIEVQCQCGKRYAAPERLAGKRLKCPACGQPIDVIHMATMVVEEPEPPMAAMVVDEPAEDGYDIANDDQPDGRWSGAAEDLGPTFSPGRQSARRSGRMPDAVRNAFYGLITAGFLNTLVAGAGVYMATTDKIDAIGKAIIAIAAVAAVTYYGAAFLVWKRVPFAHAFATLVAVPSLVFFPIGTLVGFIVLRGLYDSEAREYLN